MTGIIEKIVSGVVTVWDEVVSDIEVDYAKVKAALPASAQPTLAAIVSDIKQGASDALSAVQSGFDAGEPGVVKGIEALLDNSMASASNGLALPLVPLVNSGIDSLAALAKNSIDAWALKQKAALAGPVSATYAAKGISQPASPTLVVEAPHV